MNHLNNFKPLVSIIIPVYNGGNYLKEAIDSALSQTYSNIEVLVINDGSTDTGVTEQIALSYGERIRYIYKKNGGVATALNLGISEMRGDYFSWLSHDDLYLPEKIEAQIDYLKNSVNKTIVLYSNYEFIDNNGKFIGDSNIQDSVIRGLNSSEFIYNLITTASVHGCTLLIPKDVFSIVGTFNVELRTTQDYDLWYRIAKKYEFVFINKVLVKGRIHEEQGTKTLSDSCKKEIDELLIKFVNQLNVKEIKKFKSGSNISKFYLDISINFAQRGFDTAAKFTKKKFYKSMFSIDTLLNPKSLKIYIKNIKNNL